MPLSLSRFPDHPNRSKLRGIHLKINHNCYRHMTLFCQWLYTPHRWFAEWNIARRQRIPQRMHSNPSRYRVGCNKHSDSTESLTRPKISPKSTIYCSYNFSYELSPMPSIIPPQIFQPLIIQPVIMQHLII